MTEALRKITTGLSVSQINEELGIHKNQAVPLDNDAMGRYMFERNKPIVYPPYTLHKFKNDKNEQSEPLA
jgi:hypothetical protein